MGSKDADMIEVELVFRHADIRELYSGFERRGHGSNELMLALRDSDMAEVVLVLDRRTSGGCVLGSRDTDIS